MLNLDQINQLETKVEKAIQLIQSLKAENDSLKSEISEHQRRNEELENIILVFKNDQAKIEEGIINTLNHLSAFEDTVYQAAAASLTSTSELSVQNETEGTAESDNAQEADADAQNSSPDDNAHSEQMEIF